MGSGILGGFAAGLAVGVDRGLQRNREQAIEDAKNAREQEKYDADKRERDSREQDAIALSNAAKPIPVNADGATLDLGDGQPKVYDSAGVANSDLRQASRMGLADAKQSGAITVNGAAYPDRPSAQKAADAQNTPEAVQQRAIAAGADPTKAIALSSAMTQGKAASLKLTDDQRAYAAKALTEGHQQAAQAMLTGDPNAVFSAFNAQGDVKLKGVPTVAERMVDVPGVGKLKTYDYTGTLVNPDGTERQGTINSHDFNVNLLPYKDQIEELRKGADTGAKVQKAIGDLNNAAERNRLTGEAAAAKIEAARAKADVGDKPPAGYRRTPGGDLQAIPGGPADQKLQGQFNQDTAALTGTMSSMDRLAAAANEVLHHPGLEGITGWRGKIPNAPGSDAANAEALLGTLKSQAGFGVLQDMRNNSKTGGALGAVSDAEGKRLESNLAALDKSQSLEQFKTNLQKIIDYSDQAKDRMRSAFNLRHGDKTPQTGGATGTFGDDKGSGATKAPPAGVPTVKSAADVAKLPSGSLFVGPDGVTRRKP